MKKPWLMAVLGAAVVAAGAVTASGQPAQPVTIQAADGVSLKATYFAAGGPGPGLLLLHQCNRDRTAWTAFATAAASRGFNVLAFDFRGYGESEGRRFESFQEQQPTIAQQWPGDVDAALTWLQSRDGVNKDRIGIAGASCAVNQAVLAASRHPEVKTLVLLSGGTIPAGRDYLKQAAGLPVFAAASSEDGNAVQTMRWLLGWSRNPENKFLELKAAGHGTEMFAKAKALQPSLLAWFDTHLRNASAAIPAADAAISKPTAVESFWTALTSPGGLDRAWQIYDLERRRNPKLVLFPEDEMNAYGYQRLEGRHPREAVEIFRMNADAYPRSANAYDSLAEALMAAGELKAALAVAEEGLKVLGRDRTMGEELKKLLRENLDKKVQELK